jgi:hypothetical protein
MHETGMGLYRIKFPAVSLSEVSTNAFKVRNLPGFLVGHFDYFLWMNAPSVDLVYEGSIDPKKPNIETRVPWKDAILSLTFRNLDGSNSYTQRIPLGLSPHGLPKQESRHIEWALTSAHPTPTLDRSFDLLIVVEKPSLRKRDRISLQAFARVHNP